jgi:Na+-translocating ferredoxin:NAD+ oxidoreductase RnfG subunit
MKKYAVTLVFLFVSFSVFAQIRNGQNLLIESWTRDTEESGLGESYPRAVVQTNGNEVKFTCWDKENKTVTFTYNKVTKKVTTDLSGKYYSTTGNMGESGSIALLTYTDGDGVVNVIKFKRK